MYRRQIIQIQIGILVSLGLIPIVGKYVPSEWQEFGFLMIPAVLFGFAIAMRRQLNLTTRDEKDQFRNEWRTSEFPLLIALCFIGALLYKAWVWLFR